MYLEISGGKPGDFVEGFESVKRPPHPDSGAEVKSLVEAPGPSNTRLAGTITQSDFISPQTYILVDGSKKIRTQIPNRITKSWRYSSSRCEVVLVFWTQKRAFLR
jgi:hypothetical protein